MAPSIFIETSPKGKHRFVMKRSHSHREHRTHHHHHGHSCADVTWEQWEELFEREGALRRENDLLRHEVAELKRLLQVRDGELYHWQVKCHNQEIEIRRLREDDSAVREENRALSDRVRELADKLLVWRERFKRQEGKTEALRADNAALADKLRHKEDKLAKVEGYIAKLEETNARLKADLAVQNDNVEHLHRRCRRLEDENSYLKRKLEYYESVPEPHSPHRRKWWP